MVAKSITFDPHTLERLTALAGREYHGNVSACVNDIVEHELKFTDRERAAEELAEMMGDKPLTNADLGRIDKWLIETAERVARKKAEVRRKAAS